MKKCSVKAIVFEFTMDEPTGSTIEFEQMAKHPQGGFRAFRISASPVSQQQKPNSSKCQV